MASHRRVVFACGEVYHVFNRGVELRPTFTDKREFLRAFLTADFYRFSKPSLSLSGALFLNSQDRSEFFHRLKSEGSKLVEIISYCFMPNHFHFLLKQNLDGGVSRFVNNFSNSYTRFFDAKNGRIGPLFQGIFEAVRIETDEQLIHVSRYIHLNPTVSFLVDESKLDTYPWSSFPEYLGLATEEICNKPVVLDQFPSPQSYRAFVHDQVDFGKRLESIKHLLME